MVRSICSCVGEVFQRLQAQQETKLQEQAAGVRPQMLHKLSSAAAIPNRDDATESRRDRERVRERREEEEEEAMDGVERGPVGREQDASDRNQAPIHVPPERELHYPLLGRATHSPAADEIDRQFSSVFIPPTSLTGHTSMQQPRVRRVSRDEELAGKSHQHKRMQPSQQLVEEEEEEDEEEEEEASEVSSVEFMSPLLASCGHHHDGNVQQQRLEDTTGVRVPDRRDILVPKREQRPSVLQNGHSLFSPPPPAMRSSSPSLPPPPPPPPPPTLAQDRHSTPTITQSPSHHSVVRSPSDLLAMKVSPRVTVSEPILYLVLQVEGDPETRIDGDASGAVLVRTVMGEKETAIVGHTGRAELLSGAMLMDYLREMQRR